MLGFGTFVQPRRGLRHRGRDHDGHHDARRGRCRALPLGLGAVEARAHSAPLLAIDLVFLAANSVKIAHGGWFPLAFGGLMLFVFSTWTRGRALVHAERSRRGLALEPFMKSLSTYPPQRVEGTAVFMSGSTGEVPHALLHNLKHNRVMHERVIFLTAVPQDIPHVEPEYAADVQDLGDGCFHVKVHLGFKDSYDIRDIALTLAAQRLRVRPGRDVLFPVARHRHQCAARGMARWRERIFSSMMRNAQPAADFFRIPHDRVIEIGTQIVI